MSSTILTNWTVYYASDAPAGTSGYKQIRWTGGGDPETSYNTVNELYSSLMNLFSSPSQNVANTTAPFKAVTPTVYQIGSFDAGDLEPWFIDPESVKHLIGGSIQSINWTRVTSSNAGIVKVPYTGGTPFVVSDIGRAIVNGTATGTLLWYEAAVGEAWIRPTNDTSTHNWAGPAGTISVTSGTGSVTQNGASSTGERLWSNVFSLGTIATNSRIYVAQSNVKITNYWGNDHVDRLFLINDSFDAGLIDNGNLTVYSRQYSKSYDNFVINVGSGGRNAVPISTLNDLNNTTGYKSISVTGASGVFTVNEVVTGGTTGSRALVLSNTGSPTTSFAYSLLDNLADFNSSETLTGSIVGSNGSTNGASSSAGPETYTDITFIFGQIDETFNTGSGVNGGTEVITTDTTHPFATGNIVVYSKEGGSASMGLSVATLYYVNNITATTLSLHATYADAVGDLSRIDLTSSGSETHLLKRTFDVDEDGNEESYSIIIDCATRPLAQVYERLKYLTRRGETTQIFNTIEGQQYIGSDYRIDYNALTGTIDTGDTVSQILANGTTIYGIVQLHHTIDGFLILRDSQGTFEIGASANNLEVDGSNYVTMTSPTTTTVITPVKVSPFGTFAGGKMFGATGVFLENFDGLDANNIQLTSDAETVKVPPITVTFQLTGLITGTEIRLYNASTLTEISGTESSGTSFSYQYQYVSDVNIYVIIHNIGYVWQRINGVVLGNSSQSIPVQQRPDRNYSNP